MPRIGISFDEVAAVADRMVAESISPTIKSVREQLGTGSPNTIHRHLTVWREVLPKIAAASSDVSASIITAISQELGRVKSEAKAEIESRLVVVQAEAAELAASGEALEADLDELLEGLKVMTTDRDMLRGILQEQASEIERLNKENERERYSAEQARTEVAQWRNKLETMDEKLITQSATIDELKTLNACESQGKISAEKDVAVFTVRLESGQEKQTALISEKETLIAQMAIERKSAESARLETANRTTQFEIQADVLSQKVSEIQELSKSCETERDDRIAAEKNIAALLEQLTAVSQAAELARTETANIIVEFDSQITALEQKISDSNKLSEFFEAEKSARIAAELKIAILTSQLEKQRMTDIPPTQSAHSE